MKLLQVIFLLSLGCVTLQGQDPGGGGGIPTVTVNNVAPFGNHIVSQQFFDDAFAGKYTPEMKYFDIEGSAFLTEEPVNGTLVMNDGRKISDVPINIDIYRKEIIATNRKDEDILLDKRYFEEIILEVDGQDRMFRKISLEDPEEFYEILFIDEDVVFYKEEYVTRKEANRNGVNNRPAQFTRRVKYYIKPGPGKAQKVKLKKKRIYECFSKEKVNALKEYEKANNLKLKKEDDFVTLFRGVFRAE